MRALRLVGFRSPLAEPGVHLSLCTGLSRSDCEVRRAHPAATVAHHRYSPHEVLLVRAGGPHEPPPTVNGASVSAKPTGRGLLLNDNYITPSATITSPHFRARQ